MSNRPTIKTKHNTFPKPVTITAPLNDDERQAYETMARAEIGSLQVKTADMMTRLRLFYSHLQAIRQIQADGYETKDVPDLVAITQLNVGILNDLLVLIRQAGETHDALQQDMTQLISDNPTRTVQVEKINCTTIDINMNGLRLENYPLSNFEPETVEQIRRQV